MDRRQKIATYFIGVVLGLLILMVIPRGEKQKPREHPWHQQTAPEGTYPMQLTDDLGRSVELKRQPRHFISLAPSITEILFAMDMGDHLMAVTQWCTVPEKAKEMRDAGAHVGSIDQPNRETIAAYRPDLIIGTDLTPPEVIEAVENPPDTVAMVVVHENMDDIMDDIRLIGTATGVPGKALRLISELEAERADVEAMLTPFLDQPEKRVLFLLSIEPGGQPGWAPGRDAWVTNLIESSHADNLASALGKAWGEVSLEALITMNPEVLLLREADTPAEQRRMEEAVASLKDHPVWKEITAIQDGRVHWIPNGPLSIPGPRVMEAYAAIAEAIWQSETATN